MSKLSRIYFARTGIYLRYVLLVSAFLFVTINCALTCSCPPPGKTHAMRLLSYEHSKLIFTGIAVANDEDHVTFEVSEIFKGAYEDSVHLSTTSSCSLVPRKGEEWIVYAEEDGSGALIASQCLLSRRIDTISRFNVVSIPPPPPGQQQMNTGNEVISDADLKLLDQLSLLDELNWLRAKTKTSASDCIRASGKDELKSDMLLLILAGATFLLLLFTVVRGLMR